MKKLNRLEDNIERKHYEKPTYELQEKMIFPFDGIAALTERSEIKYFCRQCSGCHGCR